jgi:outer membrane protein, multidrug efflux system
MRSWSLVSIPCVALGLCAAASAQPAPAPAPPPAGAEPGSSTTPDAGVAPQPGASSSAMALPPAPTVDDPKLSPMTPAVHVVGSWHQAVQISRQRSTDLRIALADVEKARGAWRQALAQALPSIQGSTSFTLTPWDSSTSSSGAAGGAAGQSTDSSPTSWGWRASLGLTQPILALHDWHAIGTADKAVSNAELSVEDQQRQVLNGVANAIVALIVAERQTELNRAGLRSALETLELTKTKERLGGGNSLDIVRAKQDVAQARSAVVSGDESVRQAREALGLALGYGEPWGVTPGFDLGALEAELRKTCSQLGKLDERADLAAARGAVEIADRQLDEVWLQFAPTADVGTTLSTQANSGGGGVNGAWSLAVSLSWQIWDGGARYGSLRSGRASVDQAQQRYESALRGATTDASRANRGVSVAEEERAVSTEARDLAVETERLARLNYQLGPGTSLDLVTAAQQRRQAEIQLAVKDYGIVGARIGALLTSARCALTGPPGPAP